MSHPCSVTVWHNNGMRGAAAAAKAVVGCSHLSLTMVRPAAVLDHPERLGDKTPATPKEDMRAESFSRFRYMLVRFELTAVVRCRSSSNDHRPCEPGPGEVHGKEDVALTTGLPNQEENVSRLIDCMHRG